MKERKGLINLILVFLLGIVLGLSAHKAIDNNKNKLSTLPKPEVTDGLRGTFGIDKNINEETIDNYLNREDSVYRDMRMLVDEGDYEAIGGDSYLSGTIEGFEAVPFPLVVNVTNLPEAVGDTYQGTTLFTQTGDEYTANYKESIDYLEHHFPKDKNIFLLCGGGGYAGMMKNLLVSLGWNQDKIYVVGAYWSYTGNSNVQIKKTESGKTSYDFYKIVYHDINFEYLTKV